MIYARREREKSKVRGLGFIEKPWVTVSSG